MSDAKIQFVDDNGVITSDVLDIVRYFITDDDVIIFVNKEHFNARLAITVWFNHPEKRNIILSSSIFKGICNICFSCTPSIKGNSCYTLHYNSYTSTNEEDYVGIIRNYFRSNFIEILNKVIDNLNLI